VQVSDLTCVICGRQTPDGYACIPCAVTEPQRQLADIADMAGPALDIAQRQTSGGSGGGGGKPGSTVPIDLGAMARYAEVRTALTTWARHVGELRGVEITRPPAQRPVSGPTCPIPYSCDHGSCRAVREPLRRPDDVAIAAAWLAGHCEWMRHRPEVDEFVAGIRRSHQVLAGLARRGGGGREYLGPCGDDCDGHVWANQGSTNGRCGTCRGLVDVAEREKWRDGEIRKHARRAAEIAGLFGINVKTIRGWANGRPEERADNGVLLRPGRDPVLHAYDWDDAGRPLYLVGDVLDLAAAMAARRERQRQAREQAQNEPVEIGA
jgi:hypothetical protein